MRTGFWRVISFSAILTGGFAQSATSVPVIPGSSGRFEEKIFQNSLLVAQGTNRFLPETIAFDYQSTKGLSQFVATSSTSGGPGAVMTDTQISVSGAGVGSATARIGYEVQLQPKVSGAPVTPIPVTVTAAGAASASVTTNGFASAFATASVRNFTNFQQNVQSVLDARADAFDCMPLDATVCTGVRPSGSFSVSATYSMIPGPSGGTGVEISSGSGATMFGSSGSGEGQGVADPFFVIDPDFVVEFGGQMVLATDLYEFAVSSGIQTIGPPAGGPGPVSLPEPATLALFGFGLAGLGFREWRKRGKAPA